MFDAQARTTSAQEDQGKAVVYAPMCLFLWFQPASINSSPSMTPARGTQGGRADRELGGLEEPGDGGGEHEWVAEGCSQERWRKGFGGGG
jgi:hypothetical protein